MYEGVNIKIATVRLTAGMLLILLLFVTLVKFFHHHEHDHVAEHSEKEQASLVDDCHICDYFLHKHSSSFILSGDVSFKTYSVFLTELSDTPVWKESPQFYTLPLNKAPPQKQA